jgi:hypothetical protein
MNERNPRQAAIPVVAVPIVAVVGVLIALTVGIIAGGAVAGFVSEYKPTRPPIEIIHYVSNTPNTPSAPVPSARPAPSP